MVVVSRDVEQFNSLCSSFMNLENLVSAIRHREPSWEVEQELIIMVSPQKLSINSEKIGVDYTVES